MCLCGAIRFLSEQFPTDAHYRPTVDKSTPLLVFYPPNRIAVFKSYISIYLLYNGHGMTLCVSVCAEYTPQTLYYCMAADRQ